MPYRREYAGRAATLLVAVVLATAGCGGGGASVGADPQPEASGEERVTVDPTPVAGATAIECWQPFKRPAGGGLTLTGQFPATASSGERAVTGTVEVTSATAVRGVVAPRADAFLVRDGRVATVPVPQDMVGIRWDLAPGKVERLPGEATLVSCDTGGESVQPGTYELYARVALASDDGAGVESFGGPWPLEVR
jgi:hypothetical protein